MSNEPWWLVTLARVAHGHVTTLLGKYAVPDRDLLPHLQAHAVSPEKWHEDYFRYGDKLVRWDRI